MFKDSDQDYDDPVLALEGLDCSLTEDGAFHGSLTVEARPKVNQALIALDVNNVRTGYVPR